MPGDRDFIQILDAALSVFAEHGIDAAFTMRPSFALPDESALERSRFLIV